MKVAVLGDLHQPWVLWPLIKRFAKWLDSYQPDLIVQVGDFIDGYNWSRFQKHQDAPSPDDEWSMVKASTAKLQAMLPSNLRMHIQEGNHDRRLQLRAMEAQLPGQLVRPLREQFPYGNWEFHVHARPLVIDGVAYIHGDEVSGEGTAKSAAVGRSTVHGHEHAKAGIDYAVTFDRQHWTMNVGCCLDGEAIAARYARKSIVRSWLGWGAVTNGRPELYPWALLKGSQKIN